MEINFVDDTTTGPVSEASQTRLPTKRPRISNGSSDKDEAASTSSILSEPIVLIPRLKMNESPRPAASTSRETPSPAAVDTCGGSARTNTDGWADFDEDGINSPVNYGSEYEMDGSDDEGELCFPLFAQRGDHSVVFEEVYIQDDVLLSPKPEPEPWLTASSLPPSASLATPSASLPPSSASLPPPSAPPCYQPNSLFNFEWKAFPNPPVPQIERREKFPDINSGPITPFITPYEAFMAIWSQEFMEHIVKETNKYAQQVAEKQFSEGTLRPNSRIADWHDTNVDELYCFFAILLATGLCVKADLKEYWAKDELMATPNVKRYMSSKRFFLLYKCLHFADNSTDLRTLTRAQAKLYKLAPVVEHLNTKFQTLYRLSQNITIDESLTQWQGRLDNKQFMMNRVMNKAASVGIKTYELCEAPTGYLWKFKVHAEGEDERTSVTGVSATLVLELLKGLEYKGHTVWMDNYYNSPALARVLKSLGTDCVGTLRTKALLAPTQLSSLDKSEAVAGQISGCTSGDVDVIVWRDHQTRLALLSTFHGAAAHTVYGETKPTAVHDYNVCMGELARKDKLLNAYPIERKHSQVWYKKLFKRFLNASVLNCYILHTRSTLQRKNKHITSTRDFRKTLINQILKHHNKTQVSAVRGPKDAPGPVLGPPILTQEVIQHFPEEYGIIPHPAKKERIRRSCIVCHKRVPSFCPVCNVTLCVFGCYKEYHRGK